MSAAGVDGTTLGLQNDASYGIAGRGVLFDWASWAGSTGLEYSAFSVGYRSQLKRKVSHA